LKYGTDGNEKALDRLKKISPVAMQHIHFQGYFIFLGDKILGLDAIINNVFLGALKKLIVPKTVRKFRRFRARTPF
jgi:hypothetical protein